MLFQNDIFSKIGPTLELKRKLFCLLSYKKKKGFRLSKTIYFQYYQYFLFESPTDHPAYLTLLYNLYYYNNPAE